MPRLVPSIGSKSFEIGDEAQEPPRHDHGIGPGLERRAGKLRYPLALPGDLDPERQPDAPPHRRDDGADPVRIELGRDRAAGLAGIGRADVELEYPQTCLLDL